MCISRIGIAIISGVVALDATLTSVVAGEVLCKAEDKATVCAARQSEKQVVILALGNDQDREYLESIIARLKQDGRSAALLFIKSTGQPERVVAIFAAKQFAGQMDLRDEGAKSRLLANIEKIHDGLF